MANQLQLSLGVLLRPAALKRGRMPAERGPRIAERELAVLFSRERVQLLGICEDPPRLWQERLTEGGGLATVSASVQHALAERLLEAGDTARHGRLRDVQGLGGTGECARLSRGGETAQLPQRPFHAISV